MQNNRLNYFRYQIMNFQRLEKYIKRLTVSCVCRRSRFKPKDHNWYTEHQEEQILNKEWEQSFLQCSWQQEKKKRKKRKKKGEKEEKEERVRKKGKGRKGGNVGGKDKGKRREEGRKEGKKVKGREQGGRGLQLTFSGRIAVNHYM